MGMVSFSSVFVKSPDPLPGRRFPRRQNIVRRRQKAQRMVAMQMGEENPAHISAAYSSPLQRSPSKPQFRTPIRACSRIDQGNAVSARQHEEIDVHINGGCRPRRDRRISHHVTAGVIQMFNRRSKNTIDHDRHIIAPETTYIRHVKGPHGFQGSERCRPRPRHASGRKTHADEPRAYAPHRDPSHQDRPRHRAPGLSC